MEPATTLAVAAVALLGSGAVAIKEQRRKVRIRAGRGTPRDHRAHAGQGLRNSGGIQGHDDGRLLAHVASLPHLQPGKRDPMEVPITDEMQAASVPTPAIHEGPFPETADEGEAVTRRPVVVVATTRFGVNAGELTLDHVPEVGENIHIGDEDFTVERILTIDGIPQAADPGELGTFDQAGDDSHVIETADGPLSVPGPDTENASHNQPSA